MMERDKANEYSEIRGALQTPKVGKPGWTGASQTGTLPQQNETLLMQKLQSRHRGSEIEITHLKWK